MRDGGKNRETLTRSKFSRQKFAKIIFAIFIVKRGKILRRKIRKIFARDFCLALRSKIAKFREAKIRKNSPSLCENFSRKSNFNLIFAKNQKGQHAA